MIVTEKKEDSSPILDQKVESDSPMKEWLVDYVGNKEKPDDDGVTVEMIISTVAKKIQS